MKERTLKLREKTFFFWIVTIAWILLIAKWLYCVNPDNFEIVGKITFGNSGTLSALWEMCLKYITGFALLIFTTERVIRLPKVIIRTVKYISRGVLEKTMIYGILTFQKMLADIDGKCSKNADTGKKLAVICALCVLCTIPAYFVHMILFAAFLIAALVVLALYNGLTKWLSTAKYFMLFLFPYCVVFSFLIFSAVESLAGVQLKFNAVVIIYGMMWLAVSMFARCDVAGVVNNTFGILWGVMFAAYSQFLPDIQTVIAKLGNFDDTALFSRFLLEVTIAHAAVIVFVNIKQYTMKRLKIEEVL